MSAPAPLSGFLSSSDDELDVILDFDEMMRQRRRSTLPRPTSSSPPVSPREPDDDSLPGGSAPEDPLSPPPEPEVAEPPEQGSESAPEGAKKKRYPTKRATNRQVTEYKRALGPGRCVHVCSTDRSPNLETADAHVTPGQRGSGYASGLYCWDDEAAALDYIRSRDYTTLGTVELPSMEQPLYLHTVELTDKFLTLRRVCAEFHRKMLLEGTWYRDFEQVYDALSEIRQLYYAVYDAVVAKRRLDGEMVRYLMYRSFESGLRNLRPIASSFSLYPVREKVQPVNVLLDIAGFDGIRGIQSSSFGSMRLTLPDGAGFASFSDYSSRCVRRPHTHVSHN